MFEGVRLARPWSDHELVQRLRARLRSIAISPTNRAAPGNERVDELMSGGLPDTMLPARRAAVRQRTDRGTWREVLGAPRSSRTCGRSALRLQAASAGRRALPPPPSRRSLWASVPTRRVFSVADAILGRELPVQSPAEPSSSTGSARGLDGGRVSGYGWPGRARVGIRTSSSMLTFERFRDHAARPPTCSSRSCPLS